MDFGHFGVSFKDLLILSSQDPLEQYGISDETRFQVSNGLRVTPRDTSSL